MTPQLRAGGDRAKRAGMLQGMARTYHGQREATVTLQAMRVGQLGLLALPSEPFAEIGVRVREGSPFPVTMFSGYANGQFASIPLRSDHEEGGDGVWNSPLGPGAAEIAIAESIALLRELL